MTHKRIALILAMLAATTMNAQNLRMLVGTYTENTPAEGVYLYEFNTKTGEATLLDSAAAGNPSFVITGADGSRAYSVNEFNDGRQGLSAFAIEGDCIRLLNTVEMPDDRVDGRDPCNLLLLDGGYLISSNYTGGSASVYALAGDGSVGDPVQFAGYGAGSHIHCATLSPDGKYIFLNDLGRDCVYRIEMGAQRPFGSEAVAWENTDAYPFGPRHMVFSRDGRFAYLLCELGDMLVVFSYAGGNLTPIQTIKAYDGDGHGSADIHLSPDGRFLYTSHRLQGDGLSIFRVNARTGQVKNVGFCSTGRHPRNFAISPDGRFLLCACRDDNRIEVYKRNLRTGSLKRTDHDILLGAPVCVQWVD